MQAVLSRLICMTVILMGLSFVGAYAREYPINELPMYGGQYDPDVPQNKKFSEDAANLGWKYYNSGDMDTAIKRFNQAWMLDRENPDAYWGFGIVMGQRSRTEDTEKNLDESIKFIGIANSKMPHDVRILTDLAFSHTVKGEFLQLNKRPYGNEYNMARKLYQEAESANEKYALLYFNWSSLELADGKCQEAVRLNGKALSAGMPTDARYEKELLACNAGK